MLPRKNIMDILSQTNPKPKPQKQEPVKTRPIEKLVKKCSSCSMTKK